MWIKVNLEPVGWNMKLNEFSVCSIKQMNIRQTGKVTLVQLHLFLQLFFSFLFFFSKAFTRQHEHKTWTNRTIFNSICLPFKMAYDFIWCFIRQKPGYKGIFYSLCFHWNHYFLLHEYLSIICVPLTIVSTFFHDPMLKVV